MILTNAQAQAAYNAMCALNNVSATIQEIGIPTRPGWKLSVRERDNGSIVVHHMAPDAIRDQREDYHAQSDFAAAYGLN